MPWVNISTSHIQNTHDDAIMKRMQIKLYGETEEQEQVLAEFKLKREMQRTKLSEWRWYRHYVIP